LVCPLGEGQKTDETGRDGGGNPYGTATDLTEGEDFPSPITVCSLEGPRAAEAGDAFDGAADAGWRAKSLCDGTTVKVLLLSCWWSLGGW